MSTVSKPPRRRKRLHNETMLATKRACRALGVQWSEVCIERDRLRDAELGERDYMETARQIAWQSFCGVPPSDADGLRAWQRRVAFWRNGFQKRFGRKLARGADYLCIPNADLIAAAVRECVAEFANEETGEIFELLLSPYEPRTAVDSWYELALANVLTGRASVAAVPVVASTPF